MCVGNDSDSSGPVDPGRPSKPSMLLVFLKGEPSGGRA